MNITKKTGRIVGALFLTVMVTWSIGNELIGSIINSPDYLNNLYPNGTKVTIGVLFELIEVGAVLGIAVIMFSIFKKQNESMALGYISLRILECAMLVFAAISALLLITLSQEFIQAGAPIASNFQILGTLLIAARTQWALLMITYLYGFNALIFYSLLYQSKLIPRFISVWGLIAITLALIDRGVLDIYGYSAGMISGLPISGLHLGLIEIFLGIWLVVKGFNLSAIASGSAKTDTRGN